MRTEGPRSLPEVAQIPDEPTPELTSGGPNRRRRQDSSSSDTPSHRRLDVQGLRAIAVLLVVAFHSGLPVSGGFIGVDVFLVISGYVITGMLLRELERSGTIRLRTFYARRIKRLLPALALVTTLVMGASVFIESSFGAQQTTAATGLGATYLSANIVIYNQETLYFSPAAERNPLLHTWTLSVEEQVYLVFPSLLLGSWLVGRVLRRRSSGAPLQKEEGRRLVGRRSLRGSRRAAALMLIVVAAASFAVSLVVSLGASSVSPDWAFYSSLARVWEFAVGAGLAMAATRLRSIRPATAAVLGIAGALAIVVGAFTISGQMPYPGVLVLVPVLGAAAVIVAGFRASSPVSRVLSVKPMVKLGDASYSWYLWHWPFIVFAAILWPGTAWVLVAAGFLSLIPAALSFIGLEQPIRRSGKIKGSRVVILAVLCTLIPTAAAVGLARGADSSWGNEEVADMQAQVEAVHAPTALGCDQGAFGQADTGPACEFDAAATDPQPGESQPDGPGSKKNEPPTPRASKVPMYLVGNSVAAMYSEAMIGAARRLNVPLTIDTHSGSLCEAIKGNGCTGGSTVAWDKLMKRPPGIVVMAATWDLGVFTGSWSETPKEKSDLLIRDLTKTINNLKKSGHHVLLVMPLPRFFYGKEPGTFDVYPVRAASERETHNTMWRPRDCAASVAATDPAACGATVSKAEVKKSQNLSFATLLAIAKDTRSTTLNLRDRYCSDGVCRTNDGDFWMYQDGLHLSVAESKALVPTFTDVFREITREQWGPRNDKKDKVSDEGAPTDGQPNERPADQASP